MLRLRYLVLLSLEAGLPLLLGINDPILKLKFSSTIVTNPRLYLGHFINRLVKGFGTF